MQESDIFGRAFGPAREAPRPTPTWLTTLQAGHGWTKRLTFGAITDDTSDFVIGAQSLGIVDTAAEKAELPLDLTGKALTVLMKLDSIGAVDQVAIYAADSTFTNYYSWILLGGRDVSPCSAPASGCCSPFPLKRRSWSEPPTGQP